MDAEKQLESFIDEKELLDDYILYIGKDKYLCFLTTFLRHLLLSAVRTAGCWVRLSLCKLSLSP